MTSSSQSLLDLAEGLTEAQKDALKLLDGEWWAGPQMPEQLLCGVLGELRSLGLVDREFMDEGAPRYSVEADNLSVRLSACWHFRLTPLGLALRARASQEQSA